MSAVEWTMRKIWKFNWLRTNFCHNKWYWCSVLSWCGGLGTIFWGSWVGVTDSTRTLYEHENLNRLNISCPGDLEAAPGRKSSHGVDFESETTSKPSKIEKIMKSRKTAQNCRKLRIFDVQNAFWLCWRSKSFKMRSGDQPPRLMICYVSRKGNSYSLIGI